ncbi:formylglycine-generating enzyme family protein [Maridesulfovibrio sp. FT414]|uniref:formylglycine-generating enzyme family protein n=1 Tax=Maridesulfovibrio sp. FT414 TaxID=2979469 RepID=UPI003D808151
MSLGFTDNGFPPSPFPPQWASSWGQDQYGLWAALQIEEVEQVMRWIRPGRFLMGSPKGELERSDDEVQHKVTLTDGYWLADSACTQELWGKVMDNNPSEFKGGDKLPVDSVSWDDCQEFMSIVSDKLNGVKLRFPSEAQWEYACRAGTQTSYSFDDKITTDQVNYNGKYTYKDGTEGVYRECTVAVKSFTRNHWGLYQMHGNVWEWCSDWYGEYPEGASFDPEGADLGWFRVLRGGCWIDYGGSVRSAVRDRSRQDSLGRGIGFRFSLDQ